MPRPKVRLVAQHHPDEMRPSIMAAPSVPALKLTKPLVHHGGAFAQVGPEPHPCAVGDTNPGGYDVVDHPREFVDRVHGDLAALGPKTTLNLGQRVRVGRTLAGQATVDNRSKSPSRLMLWGCAAGATADEVSGRHHGRPRAERPDCR